MSNENEFQNTRKATALISDAGYPLPIELRPIWRIGLICLAIQESSKDGQTLKLNKVRFLLWMLIRPQKWDSYYDCLHGYDDSIISMSSDKSTEKAVELAISKNFVRLDSDSLTLSVEGDNLLQLARDLKMFQRETEFLHTIKNKVTDTYIKRILGN